MEKKEFKSYIEIALIGAFSSLIAGFTPSKSGRFLLVISLLTAFGGIVAKFVVDQLFDINKNINSINALSLILIAIYTILLLTMSMFFYNSNWLDDTLNIITRPTSYIITHEIIKDLEKEHIPQPIINTLDQLINTEYNNKQEILHILEKKIGIMNTGIYKNEIIENILPGREAVFADEDEVDNPFFTLSHVKLFLQITYILIMTLVVHLIKNEFQKLNNKGSM